MKFKTKYITILVVLASFSAILYGFYIEDEDPNLAHKCIGFGTAGLFLVAMPLFLLRESKGKNVKDYMLTKENILKMQGRDKKKADNH